MHTAIKTNNKEDNRTNILWYTNDYHMVKHFIEPGWKMASHETCVPTTERKTIHNQ